MKKTFWKSPLSS